MTTLAACDGNWCPARDLCERAAIYDKHCAHGWAMSNCHIVPREEQVKGLQCDYFVAVREEVRR